jgi:hypothetical protein
MELGKEDIREEETLTRALGCVKVSRFLVVSRA